MKRLIILSSLVADRTYHLKPVQLEPRLGVEISSFNLRRPIDTYRDDHQSSESSIELQEMSLSSIISPLIERARQHCTAFPRDVEILQNIEHNTVIVLSAARKEHCHDAKDEKSCELTLFIV